MKSLLVVVAPKGFLTPKTSFGMTIIIPTTIYHLALHRQRQPIQTVFDNNPLAQSQCRAASCIELQTIIIITAVVPNLIQQNNLLNQLSFRGPPRNPSKLPPFRGCSKLTHPSKNNHSYQPSLKSSHFGFISLIKSNFLLLRQLLICFSRAIASFTSPNVSI